MVRVATRSRRLVRLIRVGAAIGACLIAHVQPVAHAADPVFDPGFSYVDVNSDQMFDEDDGDVALVAGEVADSRFDTRRAEGGYKRVVRHAGLVILSTPAMTPKRVSYRAHGTLVIDAGLTAKKNILLRARDAVFIGHRLDGSTRTLRARRIVIKAIGSIYSDMDVFEGVGRGSSVTIQSRQNFELSNSVLVANRSVKVNSTRGRAGVVGCRLAACTPRGRVRVLAFGIADTREATIRAHKMIQVRGRDAVYLSDASAAIVDGSENGTIQVEGPSVLVDGATILAPNGPRIMGEQSLTPTLIGEGTLPCATDG